MHDRSRYRLAHSWHANSRCRWLRTGHTAIIMKRSGVASQCRRADAGALHSSVRLRWTARVPRCQRALLRLPLSHRLLRRLRSGLSPDRNRLLLRWHPRRGNPSPVCRPSHWARMRGRPRGHGSQLSLGHAPRGKRSMQRAVHLSLPLRCVAPSIAVQQRSEHSSVRIVGCRTTPTRFISAAVALVTVPLPLDGRP